MAIGPVKTACVEVQDRRADPAGQAIPGCSIK
jgi:hypothetical protein